VTPLRALVLGVLAYGAFLAATLPAGVAASRIAAASAGVVRLSAVTGTVWQGSAQVNVAAPGLAFTLDQARWRFLPSRLLAGRFAFDIEAGLASLQARGEASRSITAWHLDDFHAGGDAAALAAFFPLVAAWQPAGPLAIDAQALSWNGEQASGTAAAQWRDASLALSPVRPLGSWRALAAGEGSSLRVELATTEGPLRLSGKGALAIPGGRFAFSGQARAEPGRERDLEDLLNLLGARRADGARAIEIR